MPQTISCPQCQSPVSIDPRVLDTSTTVECTTCGASFPFNVSSVASQPTPAQMPAAESRKRKGISVMTIVLLIIGSVGCVLLLVCGVTGYLISQSMAAFKTDQTNMKRVAVGLLNYEFAYKRFPPPAQLDSDGKPIYAWTVTLANFLEAQGKFGASDPRTYSQQPSQELLQGPTPAVFRSARGNAKPDERNVFVITSTVQDEQAKNATVFVEGKGCRISEIADGTSTTIAVIQLTRYSRPWTEPADLTIDEAYELIQKEPGMFLVASVDNKLHWLSTTISREDFASLAKRSDYSTIGFDRFEVGQKTQSFN